MNDLRNPVIKNYTAVVGWVFMILWFAFLIAFTKLYAESGIPGTHPLVAAGVMLLFWWAGLAGALQMFSIPCLRADRIDGALVVREFWMWKHRTHRFDLLCDPPVTRIKTEQGEDGPYYRLELVLEDERIVPLTEGHDLSDVEQEEKRFLEMWKLAA